MSEAGQRKTEVGAGNPVAEALLPCAETAPLRRASIMLLWTLAAGLAVVAVSGYRAPFSSNQNIYFLHGLAATGYGELSRDWLTSYPETFTYLTHLITAMYWFGRPVGDALCFLFYVLFCGVYGLAILLICRRLYPGLLAPHILLPFLTLLAVFHSQELAGVTQGLTVLPARGVAKFYPLGGLFEPQVFSVLLLLGIAAFLWNRPIWGSVLVASGCALHPAYLTCGGFAVLGMLIAHRRMGMSLPRIFSVGASALLIVLPAMFHILTTYAAADPEIVRSAHKIFVEFRTPHHIVLSRWLWDPVWGIAPGTLFKFLLCISAIILVRRTPLFWVLTCCAGGMWLLTLAYAVTGNHSLGVIYQWRGFALIVPLSAAIVTLWALGRFLPAPQTRSPARGEALARLARFSRAPTPLFGADAQGSSANGPAESTVGPSGGSMAAAFRALLTARDQLPSLLALLALCVLGVFGSVSDHMNRFKTKRDLYAFVRQNVGPSDLYLVPSADKKMESFRLETGAPLFVDLKSHPVTPAGILEWYRRIRLAAPAFDSGHRINCARLSEVLKAEPAITHIVSADRTPPCPGQDPALMRIFAGRRYSVWELQKPGGISRPPQQP